MIERSEQKQCTDPAGFIDGMAEVVDGVQRTSFRLSEVRIGQVLTDVLNLVQRYQVGIKIGGFIHFSLFEEITCFGCLACVSIKSP